MAGDSVGKMAARSLQGTASRFFCFFQTPPTSAAATGQVRNWQGCLL